MGLCNTVDKKSKESADIDEQLKQQKRSDSTLIKLLLLGAGESGKSTIAKQVKLIMLEGFSEAEITSFKTTIYANIVSSVQSLINGAQEFGFELKSSEKEAALLLQNTTADSLLDADVIEAIRDLWTKSEAIKKTWQRSNEIQIIESTAFFLDALDRITAPDYKPTPDDILRSRVKTTGILETSFQIDGHDFKLVDVGGQRSERRKWLHCFQDVTSIIFCISMSEYDQMLHEDNTVRRTEESMRLFEEICNSKWFGETDVILFMNKYDLFQEKAVRVDMKVAFPDYDGGLDAKKASQFLKSKFLSLNHNDKKEIFVHLTTATNTENMKNIFDDVVKSLINKSLQGGNFGV